MSRELQELIEKAKGFRMTSAEKEQQRISFAYGNVRFDNENITRETVVRASQNLKEQTDEQGQCPSGQ